MIRFCFVGHSFHIKTRSTRFLIEIMESIGEVDEFHSSPDNYEGMDDVLILSLAQSNYDCYVFLQTEYIAYQLENCLPGRTIIIPMYDGAIGRSDQYWQAFPTAQFISFSRTHHEKLCSLQCKSAYFRYFPPVKATSNVCLANERSAFFWERRPDKILNSSLVLQLCKQLNISKIHFHLAADFKELNTYHLRQKLFRSNIEITISNWFEDHHDFDKIASETTFYFAPRLYEGIGMSFLEAMGRGQIVVAPNQPTMNEYISHGVTGILYNPLDLDPNLIISDTEIKNISKAAVKKYSFGVKEWINDIERLKSLLISDQRRWSTTDYSSHFINNVRKMAASRASQKAQSDEF